MQLHYILLAWKVAFANANRPDVVSMRTLTPLAPGTKYTLLCAGKAAPAETLSRMAIACVNTGLEARVFQSTNSLRGQCAGVSSSGAEEVVAMRTLMADGMRPSLPLAATVTTAVKLAVLGGTWQELQVTKQGGARLRSKGGNFVASNWCRLCDGRFSVTNPADRS